MERLEQLRAAMVLSIHGGVNRALVQWVSKHHGEPQSLDSARLRAIVLDFDTFLMQPGVEDTQFTQAMIRLRNVFARHAKMSAPATVSLGPRPSPVVTPPAPAAEAAPEPEVPEEERLQVSAGPPLPQPLMTDEFAPRFAFDANSVMAEALSRALGAASWIDAIDLPALASALPPHERRA
jgi:hypothetical protein